MIDMEYGNDELREAIKAREDAEKALRPLNTHNEYNPILLYLIRERLDLESMARSREMKYDHR